MARQHAIDIAVHDGRRQPEGDGADGGGGIVPDPLQRTDAVQGVGKTTRRHDLPRRGMQVPRPAVVAEALPKTQHLVLARRGERAHVRPGGHEALPVSLSLGNARLLENDLAQPDGIRVPRAAPGQVAPVGIIPGQDGLGKGLHGCKNTFFSYFCEWINKPDT